MRKTVFALLFMSALGTQAIFAQTATVGGINYEAIKDGDKIVGAMITGPADGFAGGDVNIPSQVELDGNQYNVTKVKDHAFKECVTIKSIVLPSTINDIDNWSFEATGLIKADLSQTQIEHLNDGVFYNNANLTEVLLPKTLKEFWNQGFKFCKSLSSITIPASVHHIYDNVFDNSGLETVVFEESSNLQYLGDYTFGNTKLKSVVLPQSLRYIIKYAFADTPSLVSVTAPKLEEIGDHAFKGTALKSFTFPTSLTKIGDYAFEGTKLTTVVIPSSVRTLGEGVFYNCADLKIATINTPYSAEENATNIELKYQLFRLGDDAQGTGLSDLYIVSNKALNIDGAIASNPINIHVQPKLVEDYKAKLQNVDRKNDNIDSKMKITLGQEYASFSSAFNVDFSNVEGLKAYKGAYDADKNEVVLTQVQKVSAWNGVILKGEAGQTYEADILDARTEGMDDFSDNKIYTSVDPTWLTGVKGGDYVLSNGAFHPIAKEGFVAAGRAYLPLASITGSTSAAKELTLSFGDPTGINAMTANKTNANANVYFNIAGVKASQPMKGLNISNGKKFYNNK